jgi:dihydrofolate reductase
VTTAHVFIATSLDGYIARQNGDIDWLPQHPIPGEDLGYEGFIADIDMIVMGRGTYEKVAAFDHWPYAVPVLVLSKQLAGTPVPEALINKLQFSSLEPAEIMKNLEKENIRRVYVDGGQVVQSFLREGLITDMTLTVIPTLIGAGRPLFGALGQDCFLQLVSSQSFPISGIVQSTYRLKP